MNKFLIVLLSVIILPSCASIEAMQAKTQRTNLLRTSPTDVERATIIKRAATESVEDVNQKSMYNWLLVNTLDNGNKMYIDTKVSNKSNTASTYVKTLKPDQSYSIRYYRFFCKEGMGRVLYGNNYSADHSKNFQLIGFGPGEDYDRLIVANETPVAKATCALGGFYHNPKTLPVLS